MIQNNESKKMVMQIVIYIFNRISHTVPDLKLGRLYNGSQGMFKIIRAFIKKICIRKTKQDPPTTTTSKKIYQKVNSSD